jgi:hypothetical protein
MVLRAGEAHSATAELQIVQYLDGYRVELLEMA